MVSRADLSRLPSRWAGVRGWADFAFLARPRMSGHPPSARLAQFVDLPARLAGGVRPAELVRDLLDVPEPGDRGHVQHVGDLELVGAVLGVLVEQGVQDGPGVGAEAV